MKNGESESRRAFTIVPELANATHIPLFYFGGRMMVARTSIENADTGIISTGRKKYPCLLLDIS